ncbi:MAG: hypothetical protein LBN30_07765 [Oscillospiraceae bacterium]|jgi:predicted small lipoprotein YifL|nr:hypothetical protein [Oscillospiraceae bacterium]
MKKLIALLILACLMLALAACGNTAPPATSAPPSAEAPPIASAEIAPEDEPSVLMLHLNYVEFVGEFDFADDSVYDGGVFSAEEIEEDSRFVVVKYGFSALDPGDNTIPTYGATVTTWKGDDKNGEDVGIGGMRMLVDGRGITIADDMIVFNGEIPPSASYMYDVGEVGEQYLILVAPNSVALSEMNIHFSTKSTESDIGFDFKLTDIA